MMTSNEDIVKLYTTVFEKHKNEFNVKWDHIVSGFKKMREAYKPQQYEDWRAKETSSFADYNDPGYRCAYLHKYAMIHTGLFCQVLRQALQIYSVKEVIDVDCVKICSLGSGPGTDTVALLLVLGEKFGTKQISATLIDSCKGWDYVFESILSELRSQNFPLVNSIASKANFEYEYIEANLLAFDGRDITLSSRIANADVVTLVKFVSAAACKDTRKMVQSIFRAMRLGALLIFVDSAGGGFHTTMSDIAKESCSMETVFGPNRHCLYSEKEFLRKYKGYESQYEAKITVEIWKKVESRPWNTTYELWNQIKAQGYGDHGLITVDSGDYVAINMINDDKPDNVRLQRVAESGIECVQLTSEKESEVENDQKCCIIM